VRPDLSLKELVSLINQLQVLVKRVAFVPELFGLPASNITARGMMEEQAVILRVQNNLARKSNRVFKRIFDIVATVCGGHFDFTNSRYHCYIDLLRFSRIYRIWT